MERLNGWMERSVRHLQCYTNDYIVSDGLNLFIPKTQVSLRPRTAVTLCVQLRGFPALAEVKERNVSEAEKKIELVKFKCRQMG